MGPFRKGWRLGRRGKRREVGGGGESILIPKDLGCLEVIFSYLSLIWEIFGSGEVMFVYFSEWRPVWALLVAGREHRRVVNCKAIVLPKQSSAWHLSGKLCKHSCLFTRTLVCGHDGRKQNTVSDSNVSCKAMRLWERNWAVVQNPQHSNAFCF